MEKEITDKEREELISKIKKEYSNYKKNNSIESAYIKDVSEFIGLFKICEGLYKILLQKYLDVHKKNNNNNRNKVMNLQLQQIKAALRYGRFNIDVELIDRIFSTSDKYTRVGTKSAKLLRNNIVHPSSKSYKNIVNEIIERKKELFSDMNDFIKKMQK